MKRDMDLIRKILFYVEDNYVAGSSYISVNIDGYTEGEIYEHCMLAYQGGLISEPLQTGTFDGNSCIVGNLTNEGFDLLENIRQDTFWNKTKKVATEKGLPLIVSTIKTISTALITAAAEGVANSILKSGF